MATSLARAHRPLSIAEVRELDRITIEESGVPGRLLMELAGAEATQRVLERPEARPGACVAVLAGGGNNGGDAFVVARHLAAAGLEVQVGCTVAPETLRSREARENARLLAGFGLQIAAEVRDLEPLLSPRPALLIDGLLGTGFTGRVREPLDDLIEAMNASGIPILALDVPSGFEADSGRAAGPAVRAAETVTFGARKRGLESPAARPYTGTVRLAPLPYSPEAWHRVVGA